MGHFPTATRGDVLDCLFGQVEELMAVEFSKQVDWDGQALYIEAATDVGRVTCKVPRDTIHVIRLYSDAIGREIYLERHRIVEKLAPFLRAKLPFAETGQVIELLPCDVEE
jgi:hypothetical protein